MATGGGAPVERLTCSICLDVFSSPVTLPCAHSFCRDCVHTYWDKGDISCPLCLARFPHRPALSVNLIMEEMASGLRLQDHDPLVPGGPPPYPASVAGQNPKVTCSRHHQEMSLFCVDDNKLLCGRCAVHHKKHKTVSAVDQMPQMKIMLRNERTRTSSIVRNMKTDILKTQMNMETFQESATLQKEDLEVDFSRLISAITDVKRRVMASMEEKEKRLLQKSQSEVAKMEATCKSLEDKVSNMDASLKSKDPYTLMQAYNSLQSSSQATPMQSSDGMTFDPEEKLTESRDIRGELMTAVTSIWKDQGPIAAKPLDIDFTTLNLPLRTANKYKESLSFDLSTAGSYIWVSPDKTMARNSSPEVQPHEPHPERLKYNQVRATQSFTGGRHFWEVKISRSPTYFGIQGNKMSRGVEINWSAGCKLCIWSSEKVIEKRDISVKFCEDATYSVFLDYDSGILCLYYNEQCLHTFTTSFNKEAMFPTFQLTSNACVCFT